MTDSLHLDAITAPFGLWGVPVPADLARFVASSQRKAPLADLIVGSSSPLPAANGNRAEARILAAQDYRPLWAEIFAGTVEVGSTPTGDIWMYGYDFRQTPQPAPMYLYSRESDELGFPEADSLEALVSRSGARAHAAYRPKSTGSLGSWRRAQWLITLLSENDPHEAHIHAGLPDEAINASDIDKRAEQFSRCHVVVLYYGLAAFFTGEHGHLAKVISLASTATIPYVRDCVALLEELRDGRPSLARIEDVQALRERVTAMRLWEPRQRPSEEAYAGLFNADGYRDETAIAAFTGSLNVNQHDTLVEHVLEAPSDSRLRLLLLDVLADRSDPATIAPLRPLTRSVNRAHHERFAFIRLVHAAGSAEHAPLLADIVRRFPVRDGDNPRSEMLATCALALGDLGASTVRDELVGFAGSTIDVVGTGAAIGLRDAALYALAEAGFADSIEGLRPASPGAMWALGCVSSAKAQAAKRELAAAAATDPQSASALCSEVARHAALVRLGTAPKALTAIVSKVLREWPTRHTADWTGHDGDSLLVWSLLALRRTPTIGIDLARPYLEKAPPTARALAHRMLR